MLQRIKSTTTLKRALLHIYYSTDSQAPKMTNTGDAAFDALNRDDAKSLASAGLNTDSLGSKLDDVKKQTWRRDQDSFVAEANDAAHRATIEMDENVSDKQNVGNLGFNKSRGDINRPLTPEQIQERIRVEGNEDGQNIFQSKLSRKTLDTEERLHETMRVKGLDLKEKDY